MTKRSTARGEWSLTFAGGQPKVSREFHPLVEAWSDLDQREARVGIVEGQPILTSPSLVDYRLGDYFRNAFRADQVSTARTYAFELRTWFDYLEVQFGIQWDDADHRHLRAFQVWRVYNRKNPRRVSAATWNKGWEALRHFYEWSTRERFTEDNPVIVSHKLLDRGRLGAHREKNARASRDRWLTPLEYALWRDIGFRGYEAERNHLGNLVPTRPSPRARSRNTSRNNAFADLGLTSGLRRAEAGSLLCVELPSAVDEEVPVVGKGNVYRHYRIVHSLGLESLDDYIRGERRDAVRRAQKAGRYDNSPDNVIVELLHTRRGQRARMGDGRVLDIPGLAASERRKLMIDGVHGIEPAWLWLSDSGVPLDPGSWADAFKAANRRVTTVRADHGTRAPWVTVTPHSLRFTFALFVLLASVRAIDKERGTSPADPFVERDYSQAFAEVRDLLGHRTSATTRDYYLEPLKSLRASKFLRSATLTEMWDGLRASSPLVGFRDES